MVKPQTEKGNRPWHLAPLVAMSDVQFNQWVNLLEERTGIHLQPERKSFLLTSLSTRIRELDCKDYETYYNYLMSGKEGDMEWEVLVDRLTVHETRFFRDEHSLNLIQRAFLPTYLANRDEPVRVWSVGCATGEEPYTLAMMLDNYLKAEGKDRGYSITASDISLGAIETALRARYRQNRGTNIPADFAERYITQIDNDYFEVNQELRQQVSFTQLNVMTLPQARHGLMDIIYCQNMLIYFKRERRLFILDNLVKHLRPGGLLILGAGEILKWNHPQMHSVTYPVTLAFQRNFEQDQVTE